MRRGPSEAPPKHWAVFGSLLLQAQADGGSVPDAPRRVPLHLRIGLRRYNSGLLIDDGSSVEGLPRRQLQCKTISSCDMAMLMNDRLEEAQEAPELLQQETIIENMSVDEAARLSKVRNIGIAVRSTIHRP